MSEDQRPAGIPWLMWVALAFVLIGWTACLAFWIAWVTVTKDFTLKPETAGQFGDLFGAVNALFSGLALAGVAYAVHLQRLELRHAREDAKGEQKARENSEKIMARQAEALLAAAKLNAVRSIAEVMQHDRGFYVHLGVVATHIQQSELYRQYMDVILDSLDRGGAEPPDDPALFPFRQYFGKVVRETAGRLDGHLEAPVNGGHTEYLVRQIVLLAQHEAVRWTPFYDVLAGAVETAQALHLAFVNSHQKHQPLRPWREIDAMLRSMVALATEGDG